MIKAIRELPQVTFNIIHQRKVYAPEEFEDVLYDLFEPEDYAESTFYGPFLDSYGNLVVIQESNYKGGITQELRVSGDRTRAIASDLKIVIVKNTAHISKN